MSEALSAAMVAARFSAEDEARRAWLDEQIRREGAEPRRIVAAVRSRPRGGGRSMSLGRRCACGTPIANCNRSGQCKPCWQRDYERRMRAPPGSGEGEGTR